MAISGIVQSESSVQSIVIELEPNSTSYDGISGDWCARDEVGCSIFELLYYIPRILLFAQIPTDNALVELLKQPNSIYYMTRYIHRAFPYDKLIQWADPTHVSDTDILTAECNLKDYGFNSNITLQLDLSHKYILCQFLQDLQSKYSTDRLYRFQQHYLYDSINLLIPEKQIRLWDTNENTNNIQYYIKQAKIGYGIKSNRFNTYQNYINLVRDFVKNTPEIYDMTQQYVSVFHKSITSEDISTLCNSNSHNI